MNTPSGTGGRGTVAAPANPRIQRYRQAERALWTHYGLDLTERFVDVASPATRLRVLEIGSGQPVLFVHGSAAAGSMWAPLVRELTGFRCLILDRPGWVISSPVDYRKYEHKTVVSALLAGTLDALGVDRVHVVANSIGNLWALRFSAAHPSRVGRIVATGGGPLLRDVDVPRIIRLIASPLGVLMVRMPTKPGREHAILRANGHGASIDAGRMDEFVNWRVAMVRDTDSMRNERAMIRSVVDWRNDSFRPGVTFEDAELAEIKQPTLHVYGSEDPVGSVEIWRRFVSLLPHAELRVVENGGHLVWFDDPKGVGRDVNRFLADRDSAVRS